MEWIRDNYILERHQEIWRLNLGLIALMVDRRTDGTYFYEVQGAARRTAKQSYVTAADAKQAAVESARYQLGKMAALLNSVEQEKEAA